MRRRRAQARTLVGSRGAAQALLALVAAYGHVVYPAWLSLATRRLPDIAAPEPEPGRWPSVSVVVPAYEEADLIGAKVDDLLANGYRGSLELLVVADDPATARAARATPARVVEAAERLGKAEALNRGFEVATGELVVITDANTTLRSGSLELLVRWFADPGVGAVAGEKQVLGGEQGAYWAFESFLKSREARRGTAIGLVGELAAVRRDLIRTLPDDLVVDDLWLALDVVQAGFRVEYEREAVAYEAASVELRDEWERRTRVVLGVIDVLWRRRAMLAPGGSPVVAELWGHRLVRASFGPVAHLLLLVGAIARPRRPAAACLIAGHVAGGLALLAQERGHRLPAPLRIGAQVLFLQATGLGGLVRYVRGERPARWAKARRSGLVEGSGSSRGMKRRAP